MRVALAVLLLIGAGSAGADERFDHQGAVGVLLGGGIAEKDQSVAGSLLETGLREPLQLGLTTSVGYSGNELMLDGTYLLGGKPDLALGFGLRRYFGADRVKTFVSLEVGVHVLPVLTAGPIIGLGIQYELTQVLGAYAGLGVDIGAGQGLRFSAQAFAGLQLRSYLLEN